MFTTFLAPQRPLVLVLAVALTVSLGAHLFRGGALPVEAFDGREPSSPPAPLSAEIRTVMGRSTLDLRQTIIAPGDQAVVTVFVAVGRVILRVPEGWEVDASALPAAGAVTDTRHRAGADAPGSSAEAGLTPRLVLRGIVMLGAVEIAS